MHDVWQYLKALGKHWVGLIAARPIASLVLLLWSVFLKTNIPAGAFWVAALTGIPVAGFLAWREERRKVAGQADVERLEQERRQRELASKMVDEYVALARPRRDAGPHALATLGLDLLGSDTLIRQAIREMEARSGTDPWSGQAHHVEDVDLVRFFGWVRDTRVDFLRGGTVEDVAKQVRAAGGLRRGAA